MAVPAGVGRHRHSSRDSSWPDLEVRHRVAARRNVHNAWPHRKDGLFSDAAAPGAGLESLGESADQGVTSVERRWPRQRPGANNRCFTRRGTHAASTRATRAIWSSESGPPGQ